jgi:hypothetical protein
MKEDGKIRQMLFTCAATLVGWYNDIIAGICKTAQESNLSDASLILALTDVAPMWLMTLKSWSQQIKPASECNNPESVMENASITEQYIGVTCRLNDSIGGLLSKLKIAA